MPIFHFLHFTCYLLNYAFNFNWLLPSLLPARYRIRKEESLFEIIVTKNFNKFLTWVIRVANVLKGWQPCQLNLATPANEILPFMNYLLPVFFLFCSLPAGAEMKRT